MIRRGLLGKMVLANLVVITVVGLAAALNYQLAVQALRQEARWEADQIVGQMVSNLDALVADLDRMTLACAGNEAVIEILRREAGSQLSPSQKIADFRQMGNELYTIAAYRPSVSSFTVFALSGENYYSGSKSPRVGYEYHSDAWYQALGGRSSVLLSTHRQTHVMAGTEDVVVSVARKVIDPNARVTLGYVLIDLRVDAVAALLQTRPEFGRCVAEVKAANGDPIYATPEAPQDQPYLFTRAMAQRSGWSIAFGVSEGALFRGLADFSRATWISLAATLVVAVGLSVLLARRITRPLAELQRAMAQVSRGEWTVSVPARGHDEVGELARGFNTMVSDAQRLLTRAVVAEVAGREARLQALQAQINPHFLYNTLAVIDGIAAVYGAEGISTVSRALAGLFRYAVSDGDLSTFEVELAQMGAFLAIQEVRLHGNLRTKIHADPEALGCLCPKLILQPLLENAFVHGFADTLDGAVLEVAVHRTLDGIVVRVEDNGRGLGPDYTDDQAPKPGTIGLRNVRERLEVLYGPGPGGRPRLSLTPRVGGGVVAQIVLPAGKGGEQP